MPALVPTLRMLALIVLVMIVFAVVDRHYLGFNPIRKLPPQVDAYYVFRLALCILLGWALASTPDWSNYQNRLTNDSQRIGHGSARLAAFVLALFLISPETLFQLAVEDSLIEWVSFACLVLAFVIFLSVIPHTTSPLERGFLFLMGLLAFLIAMEEISWFQRVIDVETPEVFLDNDQKETNFHNYWTYESEIAYYTLSALFLMHLPFVLACAPELSQQKIFRLLPSIPAAFPAIVATGLTYNMWNTLPIQITFWCGVFLLFTLARHDPKLRRISLTLLAIVVIAQTAYLLGGHRLVRAHELSEYRETLIAMALLVYAWQVRQGVRRLSG